MKSLSSVEQYIDSKKEWEDSLLMLRELMEATPLKETIKWGIPTYTLNHKNVVSFSAFKSYVGIWFFNGVFLKDPEKKLVNAQDGVTRGQRQWRFKSSLEIRENKKLILTYLEEAIRNQEEGKAIKPQRDKKLEVPRELKLALQNNPVLSDSFQLLSLSKQREYCEYINQAKRDETRQKRLEKIFPMLMEGVGLNDKYKK